MKSAINLFILLFVCSLTFGQNNQADTTKKKDQKNNVATQQVQVTPGASGVKRSIGYKFSSSTEAIDPGNGVFRFDNGVAADVTTEVAAVTQTNNQVQVVVAEPPVQVQAVVTEPPVQVMDTVKTKPANQGNQVAAAAVVTAGTVVAAQAVNPPRTAPVNITTRREQTTQITQTTQTGQRTQTTQPTQSKPVT
jgi:hypothetical protein